MIGLVEAQGERRSIAVDYPAVVKRLVAAGADTSVVDFPTGNARIDEAIKEGRGATEQQQLYKDQV